MATKTPIPVAAPLEESMLNSELPMPTQNQRRAKQSRIRAKFTRRFKPRKAKPAVIVSKEE